jgi:hypothetical protein
VFTSFLQVENLSFDSGLKDWVAFRLETPSVKPKEELAIEVGRNAMGLDGLSKGRLGKCGSKETIAGAPFSIAGKEVVEGAERPSFADNVVLDEPIDAFVIFTSHEKASSRTLSWALSWALRASPFACVAEGR